MHTVCKSRGKRLVVGVAEKRVALVAKDTVQKLGYEDVKACQLEVIAGCSDWPRCVHDFPYG